jgi:hypothetical protein
MKKFFWPIFTMVILTIISILCSFWRIIPTVTSTGETFIGIIVSLLGIIVTFVIAYQIWSTLDVRERVNKIEALEKKIKVVEKDIEHVYNSTMAKSYMNSAQAADYAGNLGFALSDYVCTLRHALRCSAIETAELILDDSVSRLLDRYELISQALAEVSLKNMDLIITEHTDNKHYKHHITQLTELRDKLAKKIEDSQAAVGGERSEP